MKTDEKIRKPLVIDIKGNSLDDGPGTRSVVFFKGCPLDCVWCQNPESKSPEPELLFDSKKCVKCGECASVCKTNAISFDGCVKINRAKCVYCFACVDNCPSKALTRAGTVIEIEDIVSKIIQYKPFFKNSGGGVTLSGGEPVLFMDFASLLLEKLKKHEIQTLVETSGCFNISDFESKILLYTDTIFMDIKFIDNELHKKYCGISNTLILSNFIYLYNKSKEKKFEILPRTPLIPGLTDTDKNITDIINFYKKNNVTKAGLMKNNPIWFDKNEKLGIKKDNFPVNSAARFFYDLDIFKKIKSKFQDNGIAVLEY